MGAWRMVKSIVNSKYICSNQKGETWSNMTSVYAYSKKVTLCKRDLIFFKNRITYHIWTSWNDNPYCSAIILLHSISRIQFVTEAPDRILEYICFKVAKWLHIRSYLAIKKMIIAVNFESAESYIKFINSGKQNEWFY